MRTLQGFSFCDTVEISFFKKKHSSCFLATSFSSIQSIRGFTFHYVLDVDSNTFDTFYILDFNNGGTFHKLSNITDVLTCRMVLFEKYYTTRWEKILKR